MRASRLRLLPVSAVIVAGAVFLPVSATAEPAHLATTPIAQAQAHAPVAYQTPVSEEPEATPPLWLLLLLAPVLIGGAVGVGITLRRLR